MSIFDRFKRNDYDDDDEIEETEEKKEDVRIALGGNDIGIKVIKPQNDMEQALWVINNVKNKRTVLLNLENTEPSVCRRIIDIVSGAAYALGAEIKKTAKGTYFIIPRGVDAMGYAFDEDDSEEFSDI